MRCRASDHGLEYVMYVPETEENVEKIFAKRLSGKNVTREEELKFKTAFMQFAAEEYSRLGWVMQLHYGCKRDNNTKMYKKSDRIQVTTVSAIIRLDHSLPIFLIHWNRIIIFLKQFYTA